MRAGDYVLQGRHPHGRSLWFESENDFDIAENALAQVGAEHLRDRWMHEISGGEKQRVVLARALAQQPLVLLLDEPTLHLDIGAQVELLTRSAVWPTENRYTVIVVTHELGLAAEFADQVVLLHHGKCLRVGHARGGLSARTARAGVRSAARSRDRPRGPPARPDPRRALAGSADRRIEVGRRVRCRSCSIRRRRGFRLVALHSSTADSAFGKTVQSRRRRATVRRRHCAAEPLFRPGPYRASRMGRRRCFKAAKPGDRRSPHPDRLAHACAIRTGQPSTPAREGEEET